MSSADVTVSDEDKPDSVDKLENRIDQLFTLFEKLREDGETVDEMLDRLETMDARVDRLEDEVASLRSLVQNDSKQAKVGNIVRNARNKADTKQKGVVMTYKDIQAATGVSSTMAYNYIDELPDEFAFLHDRDDLPTHVEEDSLAKDRGLVVDLQAVERDTDVFNRLLNVQDEKGGSA
jgi:archaellum component FlaC